MRCAAPATFSFALDRVPPGPGPGFRRLAGALKEELAALRPAGGTRLPPVRELAARLRLHSSTVRGAYNLLEAEGWVASHVGRGTFVGPLAPDTFPFRFPPPVERALALAGYHHDLEEVPPGCVDFFSLAPEVEPGALELFKHALAEALREDGERLLSYGQPAGLPALRREVAGRLSRGGRRVAPEEVLITSGAQQALELVVRCFLAPGEAVVAACPTYLHLLGAVEALGVRLLPVPAGPDGVDLGALERAVSESGVRLLYAMPSFQNPTGLTLGLEERHAFLEAARRARLPVLEDDLEGHQRYEGESLPSLHALDREGRVILAGSVSKALFPGLRVGWVAAPKAPAARLQALKRFADLETAALPQAALARIFASGAMAGPLERLARRLRERRDLVVENLRRRMPEGCRWTVPQGGSALWLEFPPPVESRELAAAARRAGLLVAPGDLFYPDRRRSRAVRLAFARVALERIPEGVEALAELARDRISDKPEAGEQAPIL